MDEKLNQDLILQSFPESFSQFVINYHMNKLNLLLPELLNMLKTAQGYFKGDKANHLLLVDGKKKGAMKNGSKRKLNPNKSIKKKKAKNSSKDGSCCFCSKKGHWKKNCKEYLASLKQDASGTSKCLFMIQTNLSLSSSISNSCVLNIAYGSHIYKSL